MKKSKIVFALLAILIGWTGAHWFFVGNKKKGAAYLACSIVGWFWNLIALIVLVLSIYDFITHLLMSDEEFDTKYHLNA